MEHTRNESEDNGTEENVTEDNGTEEKGTEENEEDQLSVGESYRECYEEYFSFSDEPEEDNDDVTAQTNKSYDAVVRLKDERMNVNLTGASISGNTVDPDIPISSVTHGVVSETSFNDSSASTSLIPSSRELEAQADTHTGINNTDNQNASEPENSVGNQAGIQNTENVSRAVSRNHSSRSYTSHSFLPSDSRNLNPDKCMPKNILIPVTLKPTSACSSRSYVSHTFNSSSRRNSSQQDNGFNSSRKNSIQVHQLPSPRRNSSQEGYVPKEGLTPRVHGSISARSSSSTCTWNSHRNEEADLESSYTNLEEEIPEDLDIAEDIDDAGVVIQELQDLAALNNENRPSETHKKPIRSSSCISVPDIENRVNSRTREESTTSGLGVLDDLVAVSQSCRESQNTGNNEHLVESENIGHSQIYESLEDGIPASRLDNDQLNIDYTQHPTLSNSDPLQSATVSRITVKSASAENTVLSADVVDKNSSLASRQLDNVETPESNVETHVSNAPESNVQTSESNVVTPQSVTRRSSYSPSHPSATRNRRRTRKSKAASSSRRIPGPELENSEDRSATEPTNFRDTSNFVDLQSHERNERIFSANLLSHQEVLRDRTETPSADAEHVRFGRTFGIALEDLGEPPPYRSPTPEPLNQQSSNGHLYPIIEPELRSLDEQLSANG